MGDGALAAAAADLTLRSAAAGGAPAGGIEAAQRRETQGMGCGWSLGRQPRSSKGGLLAMAVRPRRFPADLGNSWHHVAGAGEGVV